MAKLGSSCNAVSSVYWVHLQSDVFDLSQAFGFETVDLGYRNEYVVA